jgi:hypothetical protein
MQVFGATYLTLCPAIEVGGRKPGRVIGPGDPPYFCGGRALFSKELPTYNLIAGIPINDHTQTPALAVTCGYCGGDLTNTPPARVTFEIEGHEFAFCNHGCEAGAREFGVNIPTPNHIGYNSRKVLA